MMTREEQTEAVLGLIELGLVKAVRCPDGLVRYQLTDAGRAYQDGDTVGDDPLMHEPGRA